jgi:hypothetical protein
VKLRRNRPTLRFVNHFPKIRAMWAIARGGSVYFNMNQSRESWVNSTRSPFFSHGCMIEGKPVTSRDVWQ